MSYDSLPSAAGWRVINAASDLMFPLDAQLNSDLPHAPRWDRGANPPQAAEVAVRWNPFGNGSDLPFDVELVSALRRETDLTLILRATYTYPHDPLLARWEVVFQGCTGRKEEPFDLPGNPLLPQVQGQPPSEPVLLEILYSRWALTQGMLGRPPQTLHHFVIQVAPGLVCHIAAQCCLARCSEENEGLPGEVGVLMGVPAASSAGREAQ